MVKRNMLDWSARLVLKVMRVQKITDKSQSPELTDIHSNPLVIGNFYQITSSFGGVLRARAQWEYFNRDREEWAWSRHSKFEEIFHKTEA